MPRFDRADIKPGLRMEGAAYPAETADDPRRHVTKGQFMTSSPRPVPTKQRQPPDTSSHHAANIAEISRRLQAVKAQLDSYKAKQK